MKKFILGVLTGVILFIPAGVFAYTTHDVDTNPWANDIYRFQRGCEDNDSSTLGETCGTVSVFDDQENNSSGGYINW